MLLQTASMAPTASNQYVYDCVTLTMDSTEFDVVFQVSMILRGDIEVSTLIYLITQF